MARCDHRPCAGRSVYQMAFICQKRHMGLACIPALTLKAAPADGDTTASGLLSGLRLDRALPSGAVSS